VEQNEVTMTSFRHKSDFKVGDLVEAPFLADRRGLKGVVTKIEDGPEAPVWVLWSDGEHGKEQHYALGLIQASPKSF
tara:strand:- start:359 stop:589 length:231 start_codon:yes stop_codon:yes gene_type:complete